MAWKKERGVHFQEAYKNKNIPILTLDNRWHELFPDFQKTSTIKSLENKVNELLKSQGKMVNDIKEMKKLKSTLINEIVANMESEDSDEGRLKTKKVEKSQKMILDINEKIKLAEDNLVNIPYKIKSTNEELLEESMRLCYERIKHNKEESDRIAQWIAKVRNELKERILIKQDMDMDISTIYTYMHDLLGPEVMEYFDLKNGKKQENIK